VARMSGLIESEPFHRQSADPVCYGLLRALRPYEAHSRREQSA
jgi:hypothetical protein